MGSARTIRMPGGMLAVRRHHRQHADTPMRNRSLTPLLILAICAIAAHAQDPKFTALYIINFAKYVEWPATASQGDFTIAVVGDDPVIDQLKTLFADTKIGERKIVVNKVASVDKIVACNILYLSPDKSNLLGTASAKFGQSGSLIVTQKEGLGKEGASINMVYVNGKLTFEINVASLKKSGLSAKPVLFKLGTAI
jgi:hypothetical protein